MSFDPFDTVTVDLKPVKFKDLKVGETFVFTYAEAVNLKDYMLRKVDDDKSEPVDSDGDTVYNDENPDSYVLRVKFG